MALSPFLYNLPTAIKSGNTYKFNFSQPFKTPNDTVLLGDFTLPGICRLEISRPRKVKVNRKKDGFGDNVVDSGYDNAKVTIHIHLTQPDEYDEMERVLRFFEAKTARGTKLKDNSFVLINPDARIRGVSSVVVDSIDGPVNNASAGTTDYTFHCKEVVVPKDSKPSVKKPPPQKTGLQTTTPRDPSFDTPPSKDPAVTQPKRMTPP